MIKKIVLLMMTLLAIQSLKVVHDYQTVTSSEQLKSLTASLNKPYVLFFTANWCGPCKQEQPVLENREKLAQGRWTFIRVDVDLEALADVVNGHAVSGLPTLAFYRGNQKLYQRSGYVDDAGFKKLEEKYLY